MIKGSLKSQTMWVAVFTAISGAMLVYMPLLQDVFTPRDYGIIMIGLGVLQGVLRTTTTKPLDEL